MNDHIAAMGVHSSHAGIDKGARRCWILEYHLWTAPRLEKPRADGGKVIGEVVTREQLLIPGNPRVSRRCSVVDVLPS